MTPTTAIARLRHLYDTMTTVGSARDLELARNLLAPAIAALEAAHTPGRAPVEVKPLVWTKEPPDKWSWVTHTARIGDRTIANVIETNARFLLVGGGFHQGGEIEFATLASAQAAAFYEWSTFLRAAVEKTPPRSPLSSKPPKRRSISLSTLPPIQTARVSKATCATLCALR